MPASLVVGKFFLLKALRQLICSCRLLWTIASRFEMAQAHLQFQGIVYKARSIPFDDLKLEYKTM